MLWNSRNVATYCGQTRNSTYHNTRAINQMSTFTHNCNVNWSTMYMLCPCFRVVDQQHHYHPMMSLELNCNTINLDLLFRIPQLFMNTRVECFQCIFNSHNSSQTHEFKESEEQITGANDNCIDTQARVYSVRSRKSIVNRYFVFH